MAGTNVPGFTFTANGFLAPQGPAVLTGVQGDINASFQNNLNYSLVTPQGQLAQSWSSIIDNTYAAFQNLCQQFDPSYASGRFQDGIGRIYFMQRLPAVPTQLQVSCVGNAGVVIPFGALIQDANQNLYQCATVGGGTIPSTGSIILQFNAVIPGSLAVPSANTVSIYQTISGWDTVTVISGIVGLNVETQSAFELRRQNSVAANSLGAIGSIIGAVSQVPNVTDYFGYNNNTAGPVTFAGVTIPANSIYISVAGGTTSAIAQAILSKKGAGAPMAGNTPVATFDNNPLYASPIPYTITFTIPTPIQLLFNCVLINNPLIPSNGLTQVQNALIAAVTGQSSLNPAPPKARIGTTVYANAYIPAIAALGSWAQVSSLTIGSINVSPAIFDGNINNNTMTVTNLVSGTIAIGQFIFDQDNRILNGTQIVSGSGTSWQVNQPQSIGATFTGNTSGSSPNVTISSVTGLVGIGDVITGTGIPGSTTILSQTSGTPGGAGVYVMSNSANLTNISCATNAVITAAAAGSASTPVNANQVPQCTAPNITVSHT